MSTSAAQSTDSSEASPTAVHPSAGPADGSRPDPGSAMTAARQPVGTGSAPLFGLLLALGLIALGAVCVQEALVRSGATNGTSWTTGLLVRLNGVRASDWMPVVFIAAVLVGVLLIPVVFNRRPRKAVVVRANTGVYLRIRDLARVAESLIEGTDGVTDVDATAKRTRLKVTVTTVEPEEHNGVLSETVRERLSPCLEPLARAPKVRVNIRNKDLA